MKKSIKKIMSFVLTLTMCFALGMSAFAVDSATGTSSDKGTITISNLESGVTVSAYQIAKAVYNSDGNFSEYQMVDTASDATFQIKSDGSYNDEDLTETNLAELYDMVKGTTYTTTTANSDGTATFENMAVGSYLFVVTGSESTVYGMIIGSVGYNYDDNGNMILENGSVDVVGENLWAKASTPQISKTEVGGSLSDQKHGGSADIGDTLTYTITVGPIPSYEGEYPVFNVTDSISENLTPDTDNIVVKVGNTTLLANTDYTVSTNGSEFCIDFVVGEEYKLNSYVGESMTITYTAVVNDSIDETADDADHTNIATLTYTSTSYVENNNVEKTDTDHDYTFNVKIKKVDQNNNALSGATFTLYTDETCKTEYVRDGAVYTATSASGTESTGHYESVCIQEEGDYTRYICNVCGYYEPLTENDNVTNIVIHTDLVHDGVGGYTVGTVHIEAQYEEQWVEDSIGDNSNAGYFEFAGLEEGTYYIKETSAPDGYALNNDVYKIVITADIAEDGVLNGYTVTMYSPDGNDSGADASVSNTQAVIKNVKIGSLPSMGAQGTVTLTVCGCIVVLGGAFAVVMSHKKRTAE